MDQADEITLVGNGKMDAARADLLAEATAEVRSRVRRYVQEPSEPSWHDLVEALTQTYGDGEAYDLLRAMEIHTRTSLRR